MKGGEN